MRGRYCSVLVLGGWCCVTAGEAQQVPDEPLPELDFLEYLGAWAAEDDEWLVIEEWRKDNPEKGQNADDEDTEQKHEDEDRE